MTAETRPTSDLTIPPVMRVFLIVVILLTVACLATEFYCRHTANLNHLPYTGPTLGQSDDYADFLMFTDRFPHFHHEEFLSPALKEFFPYPPAIALFEEPFYLLPSPILSFLFALVLGAGVLVLWFRRTLLRHGLSNTKATVIAGTVALTSYPFYIEFNRANMEIFVWIFSALGVLAFVKHRPWWAATLIGIAGSFKFYPFIYVGLLIARKEYKQAAWALVAAVLFTMFGFWAVTGNMSASVKQTAAGLDIWRSTYVLHTVPGGIGLDHSIFGAYKRFQPHALTSDQLAHQLTIYLAVAAIGACLVYFIRAIKLPVINQVIFLTVASIVLPPVSFDYTLLHLYTPFILIVLFTIDYWRRNAHLYPGAWAIYICFMLLLAPLNEFIIHGERIEGQLKCIALLALAIAALRYRFILEKAIAPTEAATLA